MHEFLTKIFANSALNTRVTHEKHFKRKNSPKRENIPKTIDGIQVDFALVSSQFVKFCIQTVLQVQ